MATGKPVSVNELVDVPWLNSLAISVFDVVLSGTAGTIDTGAVLPTSYAHMLIVFGGRGDTAAATAGVQLRLNNDSAGNYYYQRIRGNAATPSAAEGLAQTSFQAGFVPANTATALFGGSVVIWIPVYSGATLTKGLSCQSSCATAATTGTLFTDVTTGTWNNVSAVNRVTLLPSAGNFVAGSRMTVYAWGA